MAFKHVSLDCQTPSIRLFRLLPKKTPSIIECTICHYPLELAPSYCAVSYTWGAVSPVYSIMLNGKQLNVRENIYQFLERLQQRGEERLLWVDSICINQVDDKEKSDQVRLMGRIYQSAK